MAEETESVRQDSADREVGGGKQKKDWTGKRVKIPKGTTVPANPEDGEVFIHEYPATGDKYIFYSGTSGNWVTVGPATPIGP